MPGTSGSEILCGELVLVELFAQEGQVRLRVGHALSEGHRCQSGCGGFIAVSAGVRADVAQRTPVFRRVEADGERVAAL